ncbi:MAG: P-loop NTPase, partial [Pseudomonadota bacterium]|nr:P-loop NTPase [Pseudomonadota bacterium]
MSVTPRPRQRRYGNPGAAARGEKLLAVASGKGGVGKTWFSITLAQALSQRGQRTLL